MADSPFADPDFRSFMHELMANKQQQAPAGPDLGALLGQIRNDPQGDANRAYMPGRGGAGSPWAGPLTFNSGAEHMSPEALAATQGRSATTQWAQLGANPNVDALGLTALMGKMTPLPGEGATPSVDQFSDPFFVRRMDKMEHPIPFQIPGAPEVRKATPVGAGGVYGQNNKVTLPEGSVVGDGTTSYRRIQQGPQANDGPQGAQGQEGPTGLSSLMPQPQQTDPWSGIKALLGLLRPQQGPKKPVPFGASASPQPGFSF